MKPTWQLVASILCGLFMASYIVNFVFGMGYNRPALLYAWLGLMGALLFYQQHRKRMASEIAQRDKLREEKEFEEWAKTRG
jgi:hypothetical protein